MWRVMVAQSTGACQYVWCGRCPCNCVCGIAERWPTSRGVDVWGCHWVLVWDAGLGGAEFQRRVAMQGELCSCTADNIRRFGC